MLPFVIVKLVSTTWILGRENNHTVEPISATTSRKRPFPISDHLSTPVLFFYAATSRKRPLILGILGDRLRRFGCRQFCWSWCIKRTGMVLGISPGDNLILSEVAGTIKESFAEHFCFLLWKSYSLKDLNQLHASGHLTPKSQSSINLNESNAWPLQMPSSSRGKQHHWDDFNQCSAQPMPPQALAPVASH